MELATALIWTLRILLPVILFCIYFKLQAPKDEQAEESKGPRYSRAQLLSARKAIADSPVPESIAEITLKDQSQAPAIFGGSRGARGGKGEGRQRGERREGNERSREKKTEKGSPVKSAAPVEKDTEKFDENREKMQIESLLNFVAFNPAVRQQRVFLPDSAGGLPPPPPPPRAAAESSDQGVTGDKAEKANSDVQMVLRGAMKFKRAEVASALYEKLADQHVEISETTFVVMIEACLLARELKMASDFLLKMENSGFCPDSELLDKVMDLYSQQKVQREREKLASAQVAPPPPEAAEALDMVFPPIEEVPEGSRAKLSSEAPVFVPSFGEGSKLSTDAAPFIPSVQPDVPQANVEVMPVKETSTGLTTEGAPRTKLKASSKSFEPQLNLTFDPYLYTWTTSDEQMLQNEVDTTYVEPGQGKTESKKGKGKDKSAKDAQGRGKGKGKAKSEAQEENASSKSSAKAKPKAKAKEKSSARSQKESKEGDKDTSAKQGGTAQPKWKVKT